MTENPQYNRATCYFCLSEERQILEEHHIVPRRFDGSDDDENLVRVCPTCHQKLERLYDDRFYDELGVENSGSDSGDVEWSGSHEDSVAVIHTWQGGGIETLNLLDVIEDIARSHEHGAPAEELHELMVREYDIDTEDLHHIVTQLKQKGEVYEPEPDVYRTT